MLKKTITYENFDGEDVTEDFYFNMTKAELLEIEITAEGGEGFEALLRRVVASNDGNEIMKTMKKIITKAYGERSADGKRFMKNDEISQAFLASEAYSVLFLELCTDSEASVAFIKGMLPHSLQTQLQEEDAAASVKEPVVELQAVQSADDTEEVDVDAILAEMPSDEKKQTIKRTQVEFLKKRLTEKQLEQHLLDKEIVD